MEHILNIVDFGTDANQFLGGLGAEKRVTVAHVVKVRGNRAIVYRKCSVCALLAPRAMLCVRLRGTNCFVSQSTLMSFFPDSGNDMLRPIAEFDVLAAVLAEACRRQTLSICTGGSV
jgi:hypothetical protein